MTVIRQIRKPISLIDPTLVLENGRTVYGTDDNNATISIKTGDGVSEYQNLLEELGGSGGGGIISKTYDELFSLFTNSELVPGQQYLLTDFITSYQQVSTNIVTTASQGEELILTAIASNAFNSQVTSTLYPTDKIEYDITKNVVATGTVYSTFDGYNAGLITGDYNFPNGEFGGIYLNDQNDNNLYFWVPNSGGDVVDQTFSSVGEFKLYFLGRLSSNIMHFKINGTTYTFQNIDTWTAYNSSGGVTLTDLITTSSGTGNIRIQAWDNANPEPATDTTSLPDPILPSNRNGAITYREDTIFDCSAYFDFRNILFRRWQADLTQFQTYQSGNSYFKNTLITDGDNSVFLVLQAAVNDQNGLGDGDYFAFAFNAEDYVVCGSTGSNFYSSIINPNTNFQDVLAIPINTYGIRIARDINNSYTDGLNNIVVRDGNLATFDEGCRDITIFNNSSNVRIGQNCTSITVSNCSDILIADGCGTISINNTYVSTFGLSCSTILTGTASGVNFEAGCYSMIVFNSNMISLGFNSTSSSIGNSDNISFATSVTNTTVTSTNQVTIGASTNTNVLQDCSDITILPDSTNNTFNGCDSVFVGHACNGNTFFNSVYLIFKDGAGYNSNTINDNCDYLTIGMNSSYNTFTSSCINVVIEDTASENIFFNVQGVKIGYNSTANVIGDVNDPGASSVGINIGENCNGNIIGQNCIGIQLKNSSNIQLGDNCSSIYFYDEPNGGYVPANTADIYPWNQKKTEVVATVPDGTITTFSLLLNPGTTQQGAQIDDNAVYINGVFQDPFSYSFDSGSLVFQTPPPSGAVIIASYRYNILDQGYVAPTTTTTSTSTTTTSTTTTTTSTTTTTTQAPFVQTTLNVLNNTANNLTIIAQPNKTFVEVDAGESHQFVNTVSGNTYSVQLGNVTDVYFNGNVYELNYSNNISVTDSLMSEYMVNNTLTIDLETPGATPTTTTTTNGPV